MTTEVYTPTYQTPKEAGYKYVGKWGDKEYVFLNIHTGVKEVFACNKNHAGWALKWRNTHLEFCWSMA